MPAMALFFIALGTGAILLVSYFVWQLVRLMLLSPRGEVSRAISQDHTVLRAKKEQLLTAISDIGFEKAMGKISDDDFAALDKDLRTEAKQVLAELDLDLEPYRQRAEQLVAKTQAEVKP